MHRGWIEHAPQNDFTFNTLAAAKRSARKYWNVDNNQYAIIYTTSEQGVSADVTQVRPIT
jgi:hypothetical protein